MNYLKIVAVAIGLLCLHKITATNDAQIACDKNTQKIYASMIHLNLTGNSKDSELERFQWMSRNLTRALFAPSPSGSNHIHFKHWLIAPATECNNNGAPSAEQNLNFAHRRIWENFHLHHKGCNDVAVIFQYDAVMGRADAGTIILDYLRAQPDALPDITYLGFCFKSVGIPKFLEKRRFREFHPQKTGLAPHCLHAYAITATGAQKMLSSVDVCNKGAADSQIASLANDKKISYTFFNESNRYDWVFNAEQFARYGVHWKDDEMHKNRDGLFAQGELDNSLVWDFPDGTAVHDLGRHQSVLILYEQTWRYIPNVEIFLKLLGEAPKGYVKVLTTWQLQHWPEGKPLTDADVPAIQKVINFTQT